MDFTKTKDFFIGIDSDGTVFDSMTLKHTFSFIPVAIKVFGLEEYKDEFTKEAEKINLYSLTRGVNRFPALLMTFDKINVPFDTTDFENYVNSDFPFSNKGLEDYILKNPSCFLDKVLKWSYAGDKLFEKLCEDIKPFENVKKTITKMKEKADIMVVSAASSKGLEKDWAGANLAMDVSFIAGQEFGKKGEQLLFAKEKGYDEKNMLMIGDAPGDKEAAKMAGAMFYPIIPGKENESWQMLNEKYLDLFFDGKYDENIQNELYSDFINFLKGDSVKW